MLILRMVSKLIKSLTYIPENVSALSKSNIATIIFFYGGCWGACSNLNKQDYRFIA